MGVSVEFLGANTQSGLGNAITLNPTKRYLVIDWADVGQALDSETATPDTLEDWIAAILFRLIDQTLADTDPQFGWKLTPSRRFKTQFNGKVFEPETDLIGYQISTTIYILNTFFPARPLAPESIYLFIKFLNMPSSSVDPIQSIDIEFSEVIDLASFDFNDLSLTRDSGNNLINSGVSIEYISGTNYKINGLRDLTSMPGAYRLIIDTSGIKNLAGNIGDTIAEAFFSIVPAITYISNLPPTTSAIGTLSIKNNQWLAVGFTTGNSVVQVNSITLRLRLGVEIFADPQLLMLTLCESDAVGWPGNEIANFNVPVINIGSSALYTFDLPIIQILSFNTTYHLLARSSVIADTYFWAITSSLTETGVSDWSINDYGHYSNDQGNTWYTNPYGPHQFSVSRR